MGADIATKETLAFYNVLQSFADKVQNSWVDAYVDNQALLHSWNRQGSRSQPLTAALKLLFEATLRLNIDFNVYFIPSSGNPADAPSRRLNLEDSKLSPTLWCLVENLYGGDKGHSVDLTAHASNVQSDRLGHALPFFSEGPLANSLGVNVFAQSPDLHSPEFFENPYVFPPICLIPHVFTYLNSLELSNTIVISDVHPQRFWWPLLVSCSSSHLLATRETTGAVLVPSKNGFSDEWPIPWDLCAFRISL